MKPLRKSVALAVATVLAAVHADTLTVTTTDLYGEGSLPSVIEAANNSGEASHILFDIPGGGTIETNVDLPMINSPMFIDGSNASGDVVIKGLAPNGPGAPASGFIFGDLAMHSTIRNVKTEGFLNAIWIKTSKVTVSHCRFTNAMARAVLIEPTEIHSGGMSNLGSAVMYSTFDSCASLAIEVNREGGTTISDNIINSGSVIIDSSENVTVRFNTFDNSGAAASAAIRMLNGRNSYFSNNTFKNLPAVGIHMTDSDEIDVWNSIDNNTFENNKGWDIRLQGTDDTRIINNRITGDSFAFEAGISLEGTEGTKVQRNTITGGRVSVAGGKQVQIGGNGEDGNTITNDPQGVSAYAAIMVANTQNSYLIGNEIANNSSNGILLDECQSVETYYNSIHDNGRTAIKMIDGSKNAIRYNTMWNQHADALGGTNSIALLGSANNGKEAPVISSVVTDGATEVVVTGTGLPGDVINVLQSNQSVSPLSYDAIKDLSVTGVQSDSTWTVTIPASEVALADLYVTANATDMNGNSSELAHVVGAVLTDGIAGPAEVTRGLAYTYSVANIEGANFQWWVNGDVTITGNGANVIEAIFHNVPGTTVTLSVGYTDPVEGWTVKSLDITVE